jgi:dTMP kinase
MTSEPGVLIVLEGADGAGLSTQTAVLAAHLRSKGEVVISTKEPTSSHIGNLIRSALKHEWKPSPRALQLLFAADRAHHLENEIEPALRANKIVVSDRLTKPKTRISAFPDSYKSLYNTYLSLYM